MMFLSSPTNDLDQSVRPIHPDLKIFSVSGLASSRSQRSNVPLLHSPWDPPPATLWPLHHHSLPSLSPHLPDPAMPPLPVRLSHPSTCTPSVMKSFAHAVVEAIIVGSSSSPSPPDPTWVSERAELYQIGVAASSSCRRGGAAATATPPHPHPTAATASSVLSLREFCMPGPHTEAYLRACV
jgi:hypothetical protein